jgi:hypothetical protein
VKSVVSVFDFFVCDAISQNERLSNLHCAKKENKNNKKFSIRNTGGIYKNRLGRPRIFKLKILQYLNN